MKTCVTIIIIKKTSTTVIKNSFTHVDFFLFKYVIDLSSNVSTLINKKIVILIKDNPTFDEASNANTSLLAIMCVGKWQSISSYVFAHPNCCNVFVFDKDLFSYYALVFPINVNACILTTNTFITHAQMYKTYMFLSKDNHIITSSIENNALHTLTFQPSIFSPIFM